MSRPALATVVSVRPWEAELVRAATSGARVRLIARAAGPDELTRTLADADVIVIGAETPWLEPWLFAAAARFGTGSIGIHATGDGPGRRMVARATLRFEEGVSPERLIDAATVLVRR